MNLRLFDGDDGKRWMKSVSDKQYEILCVSQVSVFIYDVYEMRCIPITVA